MSKSITKFKNTAQKMHTALLKLLESRPFVEIGVTEICQTAGVNRSTFYSHYTNTYELLKETWEAVSNSFIEKTKEISKDFDINELSPEDSVFITPKYLIPYLTFIKENKTIYKTFMNNINTFDTGNAMNILYTYVAKPVMQRFGLKDETVMRYMLKFYSAGIMSVVYEWVNKNCEDDIMLICEIMILSICHGME